MQELDAKSQEHFARLCETDPMVAGCTRLIDRKELTEPDALKLAITALATQRDALQKLLTDAQKITPIRIRLEGGKVARWDAPDEFVPIQGE